MCLKDVKEAVLLQDASSERPPADNAICHQAHANKCHAGNCICIAGKPEGVCLELVQHPSGIHHHDKGVCRPQLWPHNTFGDVLYYASMSRSCSCMQVGWSLSTHAAPVCQGHPLLVLDLWVRTSSTGMAALSKLAAVWQHTRHHCRRMPHLQWVHSLTGSSVLRGFDVIWKDCPHLLMILQQGWPTAE